MDSKLRAALLVLAVSLVALPAQALAAPPPSTLRDLVASIGGNPAQAGSPRYAYLNKLDGNLQALAAGEKPVSAHGLTLLRPPVVGGKTLVDVYVSGDIQA